MLRPRPFRAGTSRPRGILRRGDGSTCAGHRARSVFTADLCPGPHLRARGKRGGRRCTISPPPPQTTRVP
eukprot:860957-Lingulodinium_polyedra.AAC.1